MFNQRRHDMGLGSAELLPLADARIIASEQRRLLHNKIDPIEYRKELLDKQREQALQKKREGITFESCANEYIQSKCKEWSNSLLYYKFGACSKLEIENAILIHCVDNVGNTVYQSEHLLEMILAKSRTMRFTRMNRRRADRFPLHPPSKAW